MHSEEKSIVLISKDPGANALVESVMQFRPGTRFRRCDSTLAEMNGSARELALKNDLVIFCTGGDVDRDVAALEELSAQAKGGARVLVLADAGMPFAQMRRLTAAGASDVLPDTVKAGELSDAIAKWTEPAASAAAQGAAAGEGMVLPVCGSRGGIGATTLAVNLADSLTHRRGLRARDPEYKVALVDLDVQFGTVGSLLDLAPNKSLCQMASEGIIPDAVFTGQSMAEAAPGLWVLAAPAEFVPLNSIQPPQIQALMTHLRAQYDFVVVDVPRVLVEWLSPVLEAGEKALLVTDCSVPAVYQARRLLDFYAEVNMGLPVEVVVCRERRPLLPASHQKEAARLLQQSFRHWLPHDPAAAGAAADKGVPLSAAARRSALAKGVRRLAQDLIEARQAKAARGQTVH